MKIALYVEEGLEQIVLTPEGKHEKAMLALLTSGTRTVEIKSGRFFENQLGWVRHDNIPESTMIVLRPQSGEATPNHGEG